MNNDKAQEYSKRNSSRGELLLRIKLDRIIGQKEKDIAGW